MPNLPNTTAIETELENRLVDDLVQSARKPERSVC